MDSIEINGIRAYGYTGYFDAEQQLGQWFEVDLAIRLDLSISGNDDQLANTLNYADVVETVKTLVETSRFRTLERLNTCICDAVMAFPIVQEVDARLVKVAAPIPGFDGRITVAMRRHRDAAPIKEPNSHD